MVQGSKKSGRFRKVFVKTPGGDTVVRYKERKPSKAVCAVTKKPLAGVPRERPAKFNKLTKSQKRPERPFGGVLSSEAMRNVMKVRAQDMLSGDLVSGEPFAVGRICMKLAGRDAGKQCVVVEKVDAQLVIVDGQTRRRKVNIKHLEPLSQVLNIKEKASNEEVKKAFEELGVSVRETKPRKAAQRPLKQKAKKQKKAKEGKSTSKAAKKEAKSESLETAVDASDETLATKPEAKKAAPAKEELKQETKAEKEKSE